MVIGGSSGIGLGIVRAALGEGALVTAVGRSRDKLEQARAALGSPTFRGVTADVAQEEQVAALFGDHRFDHVLVTAVEGYYERIRDFDIARARRTIDSKLTAALCIAKHARLREQGSLTFTAGIAAQRPGPGAAAVAAVNGAIEALVRALALELAPVRVNALGPGWVDTPFWDAFAGESKQQRFAAHAGRLPVARVGAVEDLGSAALLLMTNGFITGETLRVDGGHRLV